MTATDVIGVWLTARIASYLERPAGQVDPDAKFAEIGLDSVYSLTLCGDLEDWLGRPVDPADLLDHPTISALASHLGES